MKWSVTERMVPYSKNTIYTYLNRGTYIFTGSCLVVVFWFPFLQVLGRLSSHIAKLLMGKHKPTYTPHADRGDYVVVLNASQVALTGNKEKAKLYQWHTGWMGGLKTLTARQLREKKPERMVEYAVKGMLPPNNLRDHRLRRLRIFADADHQYSAQIDQSLRYAKNHMELHRPSDFTPREQAGEGGFIMDIDQKLSPEEFKKIQDSMKPLEPDNTVIKQHQKWQQKRVRNIHKYQKILDLHLLSRAQELDTQHMTASGVPVDKINQPMNLQEFLQQQLKDNNTSSSSSTTTSPSTSSNKSSAPKKELR